MVLPWWGGWGVGCGGGGGGGGGGGWGGEEECCDRRQKAAKGCGRHGNIGKASHVLCLEEGRRMSDDVLREEGVGGGVVEGAVEGAVVGGGEEGVGERVVEGVVEGGVGAGGEEEEWSSGWGSEDDGVVGGGDGGGYEQMGYQQMGYEQMGYEQMGYEQMGYEQMEGSSLRTDVFGDASDDWMVRETQATDDGPTDDGTADDGGLEEEEGPLSSPAFEAAFPPLPTHMVPMPEETASEIKSIMKGIEIDMSNAPPWATLPDDILFGKVLSQLGLPPNAP